MKIACSTIDIDSVLFLLWYAIKQVMAW
jgi:hypothetical protein